MKRSVKTSVLSIAVAAGLSLAAPAAQAAAVPFQYHPITPCRLLDTRLPANAPALVGSGSAFRGLQVQGLCGVPSGAKAASINVTVTQPSAQGYLAFFPGGTAEPNPPVSTINFLPGDTLANGAIVPLGTVSGADLNVRAGMAGTVHLILDVSGYFQ